ncbi:CopG family ribbon-helix-helix protein [Limnofasciculus baicalensis]|nr:CopG family transcriptional regulator [Limnofasciculus baicalensis]
MEEIAWHYSRMQFLYGGGIHGGRKMSKENITFRLETEKRAALDAIATVMDRDRSYLINEAIGIYLEMYQWLIEEIKQGIAEAEEGDFASEEEVQSVFAKLIDEN